MSMMNPNFVDTITLTDSDETITLTASDYTTTLDTQSMWANISQGVGINTSPLTMRGTLPPGSLLSTNGQNTIWTTSNTIGASSVMDLNQSGKISITGDDADIEINGVSLAKTLQGIQERLAILRPNEELEEKWENLRELRKAYMELETEIKEKEKMWDSLKQKSNNKA